MARICSAQHKQIGELFGKTENWACVTYHRARGMIRTGLEENENRNECNIIRDILPLYADKMVSADTASFVEEHLIGCAECRAELEKLKVTDVIEAAVSDTENDDEKRLKAFAGKINRKRHIVISAFAAVLLLAVLLGGSLISSAKFGTANFFAAANGFVQVTAADREYVEIQRSPRVVVARRTTSCSRNI